MGARFSRFHSFYPAESKAARTVFTTTFFSKKIIALMLHGVHFSKIEICMFFRKDLDIFIFCRRQAREADFELSQIRIFQVGATLRKSKMSFSLESCFKNGFCGFRPRWDALFFIILMQRGDDKNAFFNTSAAEMLFFMIFQQNHYNPCVILMKICQH